MARKTKVLFFIESLAGGGAERILSILAHHLDKERFDITVSSVTAKGVYAEPTGRVVRFKPLIRTSNRLLYKIIYHLIYYVVPPRWVYRLFLPKGNDVEVAFCEGFATKLLSHSPGKRKIAWVHIDLIANPWTQQIVYPSVEKEKEAYSKYDDIICVSEKARESFETKFGIPARTIYNPIDSGHIVALSQKESVPRTASVIRFVTTGRLVHQKGYDRLLKVAKKLRDDHHRFELWILGDGADRDILADYIEKNDLGEYVKLWGFVSNPYPYVASGSVFVCSSRSEGYSTAATEAIILGIPVITTLCAGMEELLAGGRYGCIVDNEDAALYEPMKKVLTDPAYLEALREKARIRSGDFRIGSLIEPIERLLQ